MERLSIRLLALLLLFPAREFAADGALLLVTPGIEPISFEQDGMPAGIGTEIAIEAFKRMGRAIDIRILPGARALSMLESGEADALFALAKTADREAFASFPTEPIIDQPVAMFVLKDSAIRYDGDLGAIASLRIGIIRGGRFSTEFEEAMSKGLFARIEEVGEYRQNVQKLAAKYIDIMIGPRISVLFAAKRLGKLDLIKELSPVVIPSAPAYMAFSKKGKGASLAAEFDAALKSMIEDGAYGRILKSYEE